MTAHSIMDDQDMAKSWIKMEQEQLMASQVFPIELICCMFRHHISGVVFLWGGPGNVMDVN